ncbi:4Fe-4S binding protein [Pseudodesulfovibrio senegalensis]|jgi:2-oxoglutarate ferredoxin oxidoreductase subunit delta|uniref:4Fe-4S dicluster domain-containing protein n=1 Tax=Pseudodesulfovibrio senegalensis TaxID=1721087 RepID=A0A6N6N003_9BACT|nr:4Fe-4S binding protein [Pseudodesulfovibrio senegalensis]KAB1440839.1 4Fe-4S dicluster domain-containing protein [Pseudodesulfovibrio senegalensis]
MSRIVIQEDRCKGCLLCTTVCPTQIIVQSDRFNQSGYKVAEVPEADMEKCIGCTSCALICPDLAIKVYKTPKKKKGAA